MLSNLQIRDMLIIDRLDMTFRPGLNVLTGETGAGKSILLDCLGFVLGWRGRADLARAGAAEGEVTAVFELPAAHAARAILREAGLTCESELILRRTSSADGRKTAYVNDRRVSGEVLRAVSETLVELHGQHDDRGLLNARGHRQMLDAFAGVEAEVAETRAAWASLGTARAGLLAAETVLAEMRAEEDYLRHAVAELDRLRPEPGEDAVLDARRRGMQAGARIREDIARALKALGPEGAEALMGDAMRWLDGAADRAEGRLDGAVASLGRALSELGEAVQDVEACLEALSFDPREVEAVEERLFAIRGLARKHGVLADDLGDFGSGLRDRLAALDTGAQGIASLKSALAAAEARYSEGAARLGARRREAAASLDRAVMAELAPLKMDRAIFTTEVGTGEAGPEGREAVSFTVATNPGAPSGALNKIASGGELSRFLLALKVCLSAGNDAVTMIFDEIDRGVGGATADAVGRRLARLASGTQIIVVTHSPQVAARGAHHWRVEKRVEDNTTTSAVIALDEAERIGELARMLAGENVTEAAREAARALLAG